MTTKTVQLTETFAMVEAVPRFDASAAQLSMEIYRQLADGRALPANDLADALGVSVDEVRKTLGSEQLKGWTFYDAQDRIIGFRGLAVQAMPHRFIVEGKTLHTWCAMDGLFIPEILGLSARLESTDPQTKAPITLQVTPDRIESAEPADTVMSILIGDTDVVRTEPAKVMSSFCHHIFFFESPESGRHWADEHGHGSFIVTLDEAFALGRRLNAAQYGSALAHSSRV